MSSGILRGAVIVAAISMMYGCGGDESTAQPPKIPEKGIAALVQANLPASGAQAQVGAVIFKDSVRQPLVGGDVIVAESAIDKVRLNALENLSGDYQGLLDVASEFDTVYFSVEYDVAAAQDKSWFTSGLPDVSARPGELVGLTTSIEFPPAIHLASPAAQMEYASRSDRIALQWAPLGEDDQIRYTVRGRCDYSNGRRQYYTRSEVLGREDGAGAAEGYAEIKVGDIIASQDGAESGFLADMSARLVGAVVDALTFGSPEVDMRNGELQSCEFDLSLLRERISTPAQPFDGGRIIASRSDTVRLYYHPIGE
ncbi:hypothetical protein [Hahella sp. HN01]|uniref:hypothetical protein n=1 Tax=Hahella sp. HN01 TaxID=2847262 RepID=UPI001C1E9DC9|nr:hypothetical protein [Hahella sp. HN01]MBU6951031.1 hypothetical protein [Hahella sp. HN01]